MDAADFDRWTRTRFLTTSRRQALTALLSALSAAVVGILARVPRVAAKKRKKRRQKITRNAFRWVDVGQKCRGNSANCCSGICQGKKPKKGQKDKSRCVAHNAGECQPEEDSCGGIQAACGTVGICGRTTGKASFCGKQGQCAVCTKDTDCEADFGPEAACLVCSECEETGTTACAEAAA